MNGQQNQAIWQLSEIFNIYFCFTACKSKLKPSAYQQHIFHSHYREERPHLIIETQSSKARCFCLSLLWQMFYIIYPHVLVYLWWTAYSLQPAVEIAPLSTVVTLIPILWLHWRPHPTARKTNSPDHFLENMFRAGGRLSLKKLSLWCMWQGRGNIIWNPHVSLS